MGDNLSTDDGVALLGNALATMGILFVLITVFGKVSGAHFNPLVSLSFCLRREMDVLPCIVFVVVQTAGCIVGTVAAHAMFQNHTGAAFDGKSRESGGEVFGEVVATFGLLLTIHGCLLTGQKREIPMAVALFVTAGYWFTSSTAFANPAVTVGQWPYFFAAVRSFYSRHDWRSTSAPPTTLATINSVTALMTSQHSTTPPATPLGKLPSTLSLR
jgi:glycerol uptake facilitator-like aquaporin